MNSQAQKYVEELQARGPVEWAEGPNGWVGEDGQPITLAPWQRGALEAYWQHRADVSTFAISNVKKTGKTFCTAILTAYRWLAYPGQHFAAGNDLDQAQARQFQEISAMVRRSPFLSENVKAGKSELEFTLTGSKLTALAADATGNAGANFLTSSHTEVWGVLFENSIRSFEELSPPPGKNYGLPCLRICDSYSGFLGESKVWHRIVDRGLAGKPLPGKWPVFMAGGLMLFHIEGQEAQERCFRGSEAERLEYYAEQAESLRPNAYTRMHFNQRTAGESAFVTEEQWQACYSPDVHPLQPGERVKLSLGCDASTSHDYTALIGMDGGDVRLVKVWKPRKVAGIRFGKPTVDLEATIGQEVLNLYKSGNVANVTYDPWQLSSLAIGWERAGVKCREMPQTQQRTESDSSLFDAITSGRIRHFNNQELNEAVRNAVIVEGPRGIRIAKERSSRRIDALVALSMAYSTALSGKYSSGYVGSMPDVFNFPLGDDEVLVRVPGGNIERMQRGFGTTHAPGVNYTNCKKQAHGCLACMEELEKIGYYKQEEEKVRNGYYQSNAEANRQAGRPFDNSQGEISHDTKSLFKDAVRRRLDRND